MGLLLWKIRRVFSEFPREYHLIVADDGSTDETAELLEKYQHALPMTAVRHDESLGYAATIEELLRTALSLTDRPKRDCVITIGADFAISPAVLPDLVKRFESGADVVIAEAIGAESGAMRRFVRRFAVRLLSPGVRLPGARDLMSGVCAIRLITLKKLLQHRSEPFLTGPSTTASAELVARVASQARQISAMPIEDRDLRPGAAATRRTALGMTLDLLRAGRSLQVPQPDVTVQRVS